MSRTSSLLENLLGLLFVIIFFGTPVVLIYFLVTTLQAASDDVRAALVAIFATVIISTLLLVYGRYLETKREIEQQMREKKTPVYESLIEILVSQLSNYRIVDKPGKIATSMRKEREREMARRLAELEPELILWSSSSVLRKWKSVQITLYQIRNSDFVSPDLVFDFEELIILIRHDMGHSDMDVEYGDIMGVVIDDVEKNQ